MTSERTRYLIQHRESKGYIRAEIGSDGFMSAVSDPWKAWGIMSAEDALHVLEESPYMPPDKENYRIVKVKDSREVEEDVNPQS